MIHIFSFKDYSGFEKEIGAITITKLPGKEKMASHWDRHIIMLPIKPIQPKERKGGRNSWVQEGLKSWEAGNIFLSLKSSLSIMSLLSQSCLLIYNYIL